MPENREAAVKLIQEGREAVLATLEDSKPFTSAVNYLFEAGGGFGKIILLMSDLARHTRNAKATPHVSLLIAEHSDAPVYERKRVSAQGSFSQVPDAGRIQDYKNRYLSLFPKSQIFFTLADFRFYEIQITEIYFIGGFGKAESLKP